MKNAGSLSYGTILASLVLGAAMMVAGPARAQSPVTFSKVFTPSTIGPGSVSTLRFDIVNQQAVSVTALAFTDNLPAGVVIAEVPNAQNVCGGALTAPAGGGTISFSDGVLGAFANCSISVDVTSSVVGPHSNVSGDLSSSSGNSGTAAADLTVATDRPGFSKSFAPSSVPLGGRSTLTLTVDNSANALAVGTLSFVDSLPVGMIVAAPANASTDCGSDLTPPTLTATPGSGVISLNAIGYLPTFPSLNAGASCSVTVDVVAGSVGLLGNTSGQLTADSVSCGTASAVLDVTVDPVALAKQFTDDPVPPGGTVALEFTVINLDRNNSATNIAFTDDLDATISGLVAVGLPADDVCGAGSQLAGSGLLTLTGGNLPPSGSCSFSVTLQVPGGAATGIYPNTTSSLTADLGGSGVVGSPASDLLFVSPAPELTKEFTDDPVGAGDSVTLEFTITNSSGSSSATDIEFIDELTTFLGFPVSVSLPSTPCGAGSSIALVGLGTGQQGLFLAGGNLGPAGSCTFDAIVDVPPGQSSGVFTNVTTPITATVGGESVVGNPATDNLTVVGGPRLLKQFTDDPAQPGGTVTLEFTLSHDEFAPAGATGIAFTDDLDAALSGLVATGLPISDVCGPASQISGTSALSFTGGSLAPGQTCTFSVTLQVPGGAPAGTHTNTTSNTTAVVSGLTTTGPSASDDLMIAGLVLSKEFIDDPAFPGGNVTLRFTVDNISPVSDATDIFFQDDLDTVIPNLSAAGLPINDICGLGSSLTGLAGNTLLTFLGGSLTAGSSCTFDVPLQIPGGTASDTYLNVTTAVSATIESSTITFPYAADALVVSSERLALDKSFTDDPVFPGDSATLQFTITNLDTVNGVASISFTDDLDAALSGLVASGLPMNDICGAGSQISGTGLLTLTGGTLGAGASCVFGVQVQVPPDAPAGAHSNLTSEVTGDIGGFTVTGTAAADDLLVNLFTFSKAFGGPVPAGGTTTLDFTIENLDASAGVAAISFTDDLDAVVPGMVAVGLPAADICGAGSQISGTSTLALTGGSLGPGETCTFSVDVQVPASAPEGTYVNTTSILSLGGIPSAEPATADLVVEPALTGVAIPMTTPAGVLLMIASIVAVALWRLKWGA